jgi:glycosyltransferase involved in cell wall biosynthesis
MNLKNNLSIVIPTYNRAQILHSWLEYHAKVMHLNNIMIHVQDNASTDKTVAILESFKKRFSNITYVTNKINHGAALNLQLAINAVDTKFIWPISDSYCINQDLLNEIILILKNSSSLFLIINLKNRIKNINEMFVDADFVCEKLAGVLSCSGCAIYNRARLGKIIIGNTWSNFSHFIYILNLLKSQKEKAQWVNSSIDTLPKLNRKNWATKKSVFKIGCKNWIDSIDSLNDFSCSSKKKAYRLFNEATNLFNCKGGLWLRAQGLLTIDKIRTYKIYLNKSVGKSYLLLYLIALMPIYPLKILKKIYDQCLKK